MGMIDVCFVSILTFVHHTTSFTTLINYSHHSGNVKYRSLVKRYQPLYIISKRRDKPRIAQKIVKTVRHAGGRFLKKDPKTNTWRDVGNQKAREKTSQALREGAPDLRTPSTSTKDGAASSNNPKE